MWRQLVRRVKISEPVLVLYVTIFNALVTGHTL